MVGSVLYYKDLVNSFISAETSSCNEKVKDNEEFAKKEIEKLKKSIDENEKHFRKEIWQLREQTGYIFLIFFASNQLNAIFQITIQKKSQGQ